MKLVITVGNTRLSYAAQFNAQGRLDVEATTHGYWISEPGHPEAIVGGWFVWGRDESGWSAETLGVAELVG